MSYTPPPIMFLLVMVQVYQFSTSAPSPLPLSVHRYYFQMCSMCLPFLKTLFQYLPFVPITLLMSCFLNLSFRCKIIAQVRDQRRDNVYYWSKSVPLQSSTLALSSSVRSSLSAISIWHSRLNHPPLPIFLQISKCYKYLFSRRIFMFLFL